MKQTILHKIDSGETTMRPYWQFVVLTAVTIAGIVFVAGSAVYFFSLIGYLLHISGTTYASDFGLAGVGPLLVAVPWHLVGLGLVLVAVLYMLVHRFSFSYQKPLIYTILITLALILGSAVAVASTSTHEKIHETATARNIPGAAQLYAIRADSRNLTFGRIIATTSEGYLLETLARETKTIVVNQKTRVPLTITIGMPVVVLGDGDEAQDSITARGIRPAPKAAERIRTSIHNKRGSSTESRVFNRFPGRNLE